MKKRQTVGKPSSKSNGREKKEVSSASKQSSNATSPSSAPSGSKRKGTVIGYVHKLSPPKRNKRDTMNYSTFELQTDAGIVESGLCFSTVKRRLLRENESNRTAVKLSGYTMTSGGDKIVVNDMTMISGASPLEYSFQFSEQQDSKKVLSLKEVAEDECRDMELVNVSVKIISVEGVRVVGKDKLKLANAVISDSTGTMMLELWQEHTNVATHAETYTMDNLCDRVRNGVKRLGTTKETVIRKIVNAELAKVCCEKDEIEKLASNRCIQVDNIDSIERLETFKKCVNCSKRVIQFSDRVIVHCDKCQHTMRSATCEDGIWAKVVVKANEEDLHLVLFEEILRPFYEGAHPSLEALSETLLLQTNLEITYNTDTKIVTLLTSLQH